MSEDIPQVTTTLRPTSTSTLEPTLTLVPSLTPIQGCPLQQGEIEMAALQSQFLADPLEVNVYLPPCYDPQALTGYPVLYMLHGQSFTQDQWIDLGLTGSLDTQISIGQVRPFIVVMPFEKESWDNPFKTGFEDAIVTELVPWVDTQYNTCRERSCRAVGGLSRGAAWAIHLGFKHWELFGAIGAHSAVPFDGDAEQLKYWSAAIPAGMLPDVYMDIGADDPYLQYAAEFELQLQNLAIPHVWMIHPGTHVETYWKDHMLDYLFWYASFLS